MKKNKKYWNDIAGFLSGEMNTKQTESFNKKLTVDKELNNDYRLMKKTWNTFSSNPDEKYKDTKKAWIALNKRITQEGMQLEENQPIRISKLQYTLRIAAVAVLILAVGISTIYYSANNFGTSKAYIEYKSEAGMRTLDLPDGSRVFLNEGAKLAYPKTFDEKRNVKLNGEAFFNVMADPKRPFRVNTGKVVVTVLGTSFNVKESENKSVQVYVEAGKVRVDLKEKEGSLILEPGQIAEANDDLKSSSMVDENYLSWKTKDFKFVDQPVGDILEVLQSAYHVEVKARNLSLEDMRLTSTYSDQSFDAILSTICTAMNIGYNKEGKVYILHSN